MPLPANLVLEGDASDVHAWLDRYASSAPDEVRDLGYPEEKPIALDVTGRFVLLVEAADLGRRLVLLPDSTRTPAGEPRHLGVPSEGRTDRAPST